MFFWKGKIRDFEVELISVGGFWNWFKASDLGFNFFFSSVLDQFEVNPTRISWVLEQFVWMDWKIDIILVLPISDFLFRIIWFRFLVTDFWFGYQTKTSPMCNSGFHHFDNDNEVWHFFTGDLSSDLLFIRRDHRLHGMVHIF